MAPATASPQPAQHLTCIAGDSQLISTYCAKNVGGKVAAVCMICLSEKTADALHMPGRRGLANWRNIARTGRSQMAGAHLPALSSAIHIQHCLHQWLHQRTHCLCLPARPADSFNRVSQVWGMPDTFCTCPATCRPMAGDGQSPAQMEARLFSYLCYTDAHPLRSCTDICK